MCVGFIFDYDGIALRGSRSVGIYEMEKIPEAKCNHDETFLTVRCDKCDTYMDFHPGLNDDMDGYWGCPICNAKVDEINVYLELNEENQAFLKDNDLI